MEDNVTTLFWSKIPGKFVNKKTGASPASSLSASPQFTGSEHEWYETLVETIIDVRNHLHTQAAEQIGQCTPDQVNVFAASPVLSMLAASVLWHPYFKMTLDDEPSIHQVGTIAAKNVYYDRSTSVDAARVVATFKAADGKTATLYGVVRVQDLT